MGNIHYILIVGLGGVMDSECFNKLKLEVLQNR